jgi:hypothetical protein
MSGGRAPWVRSSWAPATGPSASGAAGYYDLLFVDGVMNLFWVAAISIVVLAEKLGPGRQGLARLQVFCWWGYLCDCGKSLNLSLGST